MRFRPEGRSAGSGRRVAAAAALALGAALGGCLDLGFVAGVAFPPTIAGLPADAPYVSLPVGVWVAESDVHAAGIAGCFAPACGPAAAIGVFEADGGDADALAHVLDDPERLRHAVLASAEKRRDGKAPKARTVASVERLQDGSGHGFILCLGRPDGSRQACGAALGARQGGKLSLVLVVSPSRDGAGRLVREVWSRQG